MKGLHPEDISLDASGKAATALRLRDDVSAHLAEAVAFTHYVYDVELAFVEDEGNDSIRVVDVLDEIFSGGPVIEVIPSADYGKKTHGGFFRMTMEDAERGFALQEVFDLREFLHFNGKVEGMIGKRTNVKPEAESGTVFACEWIVHGCQK